jgi:hypothetical protein
MPKKDHHVELGQKLKDLKLEYTVESVKDFEEQRDNL